MGVLISAFAVFTDEPYRIGRVMSHGYLATGILLPDRIALPVLIIAPLGHSRYIEALMDFLRITDRP